MSWNRFGFALAVTALLVFLAGCVALPPSTGTPQAPAGATTTMPQSTDVPANGCPEPTADTQMQANPTAGYCLLVPRVYKSLETDGMQTDYFFDSMMDVSRPKLFVKVEDANGQTAAQIADAVIAEAEAAGLKGQIQRMPVVTLGGEQAERLDRVPGQDLGRVLIAVHGPRAYRLTFVPADPSDAALFQQTEALYDLVLRSFRFTN